MPRVKEYARGSKLPLDDEEEREEKDAIGPNYVCGLVLETGEAFDCAFPCNRCKYLMEI